VNHLNDKAKRILQNPTILENMKPLLVKSLHNRIQSREPIKVLQPIQNIAVTMSKGESSRPVMGGQVIPAGIELVYDGFELGQLFFKSYRNGQEGPEYSIYTGENLVVGDQQVTRNAGLMGLLVKTDIFTQMVELLSQSETE
jgi:hypothetical protein